MVMRTTFKKRSFILVLVVLTAITFFALKSETQAAPAWYSPVTIVAVGSIYGVGYIQMSSASFPVTLFSCYNGSSQQLATALTAVSLGKTVNVYADLSNNIILAIMLSNN